MEYSRKISLNSIISHKKDLETIDMDDEKVMMNINRGKYYGLNDVGSRIWELATEQQSVDSIVKQLSKEYEVDYKKCEESVLSFLNKMYDEELIHVI